MIPFFIGPNNSHNLVALLIQPLFTIACFCMATWQVDDCLLSNGCWQNLRPSQNWHPNLELAGKDTLLFLTLDPSFVMFFCHSPSVIEDDLKSRHPWWSPFKSQNFFGHEDFLENWIPLGRVLSWNTSSLWWCYCLSKCAIVVEWGVLLLDRATIATW